MRRITTGDEYTLNADLPCQDHMGAAAVIPLGARVTILEIVTNAYGAFLTLKRSVGHTQFYYRAALPEFHNAIPVTRGLRHA